MKNYKNLLFYIITIGGFSLLMWYIFEQGFLLEKNKVHNFVPQLEASTWEHFKTTYHANATHPLARLLLQIITIIFVARIFGFICKRIGQPTVIGEIAAGIFLGPSFVGEYFPGFSQFLFPEDSLGNLNFLSQIGLILFMFIIGMELDLRVLKNKAQEAVVISHASIIFPFALGVGLAFYMYSSYAPAEIKFLSFALFMGIAMSITAFPVLARIIQERGLTKTRIGTIAITCAAADDVTAWCILAVVIAVVKAGSFVSALYTVLMAIAYVLLMMKVVSPFLKRMGEIYSNKEGLSKPVVAVFFITLLISSYVTEVIGIHALFGAFLAGVIMPPNMNFRNMFIEKVEDVSLILLLPLFFVFSGLKTDIGLLDNSEAWMLCGVIIGVAVAGKFLGSALAARFVGQSWRESMMIGALMNTRGLMELVVLKIGLELGVLTPTVFTMFVLMALITTMMTGPALDLINWISPEKKPERIPQEIEDKGKFKILVPFGNPYRGKNLLRLASSLVKKSTSSSTVTALHLSPSNEINQYNAKEFERDSFKPIKTEAAKLDLPVKTVFKASPDIDKELIDIANEGNYDLTIVGLGRSIFDGTFLGKVLGLTTKIINPEKLYDTITGKERLFETSMFDERTKQIIKSSKVPVGIFIDKDLEKVDTIIIPVFSISDSFLLIYAQKLIHNNGASIVILDASGIIKNNPEMKETIRSIEQTAPNHIALYNENKINKALFDQKDLMIISLDSWKKAVETQSIWLAQTPSTLIIKP
ncbi:MAG TPA: cation:proton antiporter [Flavobacteriales bacterium]|nr:cation:proton antiporter [Flavobacteriales bacterium]